MCNELHIEHHSIPETGIAYKVMTFGVKGMASKCRYIDGKDRWIEWNKFSYKTKYTGIFGFCMFLSKDEAERCMQEWNAIFPEENACVKTIEYRDGLGEFIEDGIFGLNAPPFRASLCKAFRFVDKEENAKCTTTK